MIDIETAYLGFRYLDPKPQILKVGVIAEWGAANKFFLTVDKPGTIKHRIPPGVPPPDVNDLRDFAIAWFMRTTNSVTQLAKHRWEGNLVVVKAEKGRTPSPEQYARALFTKNVA